MSGPEIKATFGPSWYSVPDVIAPDGYRCPACGMAAAFKSTLPLATLTVTCHCGTVAEILASGEPTP